MIHYGSCKCPSVGCFIPQISKYKYLVYSIDKCKQGSGDRDYEFNTHKL